jgi:oligopeptidase B
VSLKVGFSDAVTTMFDESIPLTVIEFNEVRMHVLSPDSGFKQFLLITCKWGNPKDKKIFDAMMRYSPYDNIRTADYPNILMKAGLNDNRVAYWEVAKYVARMRELNPHANNVIAFDCNLGSGHFGSSGRYEHLLEYAQEYAFALSCFGILK